MITRYIYGKPIDTEAVLDKPEASTSLPVHVTVSKNTITMPLETGATVYGMGENVRGINKRGHIYESWCFDQFDHSEETHALYGAHNFFMVSPAPKAADTSKVDEAAPADDAAPKADQPAKATPVHTGYFVDTGARVTFDIGATNLGQITVTVAEKGFELYIITGETPDAVITQFRGLTGQSYLPPKWAFGVGQSRWGYTCKKDIDRVAKNYRENHIPLDMVYLDIDYMEEFKDFTINGERFPNFKAMVKKLKKDHVRVIPIIDAGVKIQDGYSVYEEGRDNGFFCKDEDGNDFVAGVWPGDCCFPDFLDDKARAWFGEKYRVLTSQGIDGFWNDMNEPSLFYSKKHLAEVFAKLPEYAEENLSIYKNFELKGLVMGLASNDEDYKSFYHNYKGKKVRHDKVHNLYGYYMTRAASEALERDFPNERKLIYSRASCIGMHRYSGIWMGDNKSRWSHLLMNLQMLASLNMCGFLYTGADIGGFGSDTTPDLLQRWYALAVFVPLLRNHAALGTREQEPYQFTDSLESLRGIMGLRYRLLPYIYSEFMKAALTNSMYARPLGFLYPEDADAVATQDQLFIGESVMIAPVYEQNAIGRHVYLPEEMKLVRFKGCTILEERIVPAGHTFVHIALDEVVLFIRKGHLLPLAEPAEYVDGVDWDALTVLSFAGSGETDGNGQADGAAPVTYELYNDNGVVRHPTLENHLTTIHA